MKLYIVRHGTTSWNVAHRVQGRTDTELDDLGIRMAEETGRALAEKGIVFDRVFTSPLKRAMVTARLVSGRDDVIPDERLAELCFGPFEGREVEKMRDDPECAFRFFAHEPAEYDRAVRLMKKADPDLIIESLEELNRRTGDFMHDCLDALADTDMIVLVSGHGALNKSLIMNLMGRTDLRMFWGKGLQINCGVNIVDVRREDDRVIYDVNEEQVLFYDHNMTNRLKPLL